MTAAELTIFQRNLRQMLPDLGIVSVLAALKKELPEQTLKFNSVFQLEIRLNAINKDRIRGVISQADLDLAYNRITEDLLEFIDELEVGDFDIKTAESSVEDKEGHILYRIPHTMEVEEEYRCVVRLAFEDETVVRDIELTKDTVVKDLRVSEVMEVELIDPNPSPCFSIRQLNSTEQFLEKNEYTEWIFFVKPLVTGELPLVLKVSVKELIQNRERTKEIVLEEVITVLSEAPPEDEDSTFKNAGYSISYTNAPDNSDSGSKRKMAMLLVIGVMVASGILAAGISLGWISGPSWLHSDPHKSDRAFWDKMYQEHKRSSFETYLRAYPEGIFAASAQQKIDSLKQLRALTPTSENIPPPPADNPVPPKKPVTTNPTSKPAKPVIPIIKPDVLPAPSPPEPAPAPFKRNRKSGFDMVEVPGGKYSSNAKGCPLNPLDIKDFQIGKYEITQADWREIMGRSPSFHSNCSDCPVEKVSWNEIQRFLKIASQKLGRQYRLPTEIEWEYAAKGGQKSRGTKYSGSNNANNVAWFNIIQEKSHEVGTKRANELGIYDMSGNVWEWCESPYPAYLNCSNGNQSKKALRGGSWADKKGNATVKARRQEKSGNSDRRSGFRIIEVL